MSRDPDDLVADMREAAERALRHVNGSTREAFLSDEKTIDAVVRCLAILGEAAKLTPEAYRMAHASLPWREMIGLRDRVVHDYLGTDIELVWTVVTEHLPQLLSALPRPAL